MPSGDMVRWLRFLGFTQREADILYLFLERGPLTAREISERLGMAMPHVYSALKRLYEMGLVARVRGRPSRYVAVGVARSLEEMLERRITEGEELIREVRRLEARTRSVASTAIFGGRAGLVGSLRADMERASVLLWAAAPTLRIVPGLEGQVQRARSRGCDVRVVTGDLEFVRRVGESPGFIRYVEPPPPFALFIVDGTGYFAPVLGEEVVSGYMTRDPLALGRLKRYFEHLWRDDYVTTLYRLRMNTPREY